MGAAASPASAKFLAAGSLKEHRGGEEHILLEVFKEPLASTVRLPQHLTLSWAMLVSPNAQNTRFSSGSGGEHTDPYIGKNAPEQAKSLPEGSRSKG